MTEPFLPNRQWPEDLTTRLSAEGLSRTSLLSRHGKPLVTITRWLRDGEWRTSFLLAKPTNADGYNADGYHHAEFLELLEAMSASIPEARRLEAERPSAKDLPQP